jgi:hypothetical protein
VSRKKVEPVVYPRPSDLPVDPACSRCLYRAEWTPRVPNAVTTLRCHRFPQAVEITDDHWCGEYREKAYAVPGN